MAKGRGKKSKGKQTGSNSRDLQSVRGAVRGASGQSESRWTPIHTWIATITAILGLLVAYFGFLQPDIRAVDQARPPSLRSTAPVIRGDTAFYQFSGRQEFKNHSIRGGGHISRMEMIPEIPGLQSHVLLREVSRETFGPRQTRKIEFQGEVAVTFDAASGRVNTLPMIVRFHDSGGAVVMSADGEHPFELGIWLIDAHNPTGSVRLERIQDR